MTTEQRIIAQIEARRLEQIRLQASAAKTADEARACLMPVLERQIKVNKSRLIQGVAR